MLCKKISIPKVFLGRSRREEGEGRKAQAEAPRLAPSDWPEPPLTGGPREFEDWLADLRAHDNPGMGAMPLFVEEGEKCYVCDTELRTEAIVWTGRLRHKSHHRCTYPLRGLKRMMPERVEERVKSIQRTKDRQAVHHVTQGPNPTPSTGEGTVGGE